MNFRQRCLLFNIGVIAWLCVGACFSSPVPFFASMALFHAAIAGLVAGLAFVPRTMLEWL